jgi:p-aminobenzoyl-glutamate transporter AbgT
VSDPNPKTQESEAAPIQSSRSPWNATISTKSLSVVVTGIVMLVALIKAEPKDIPEMVRIMVGSSPFCAVGWVLAVVFLVVGIIFVVTLRNIHEQEIKRLAQERDKLQSKLLT